MNKARTGKIARLPEDIRDDLDLRLENGQLGPDLRAWLDKPYMAKIKAKPGESHQQYRGGLYGVQT